MRARKSGAWSTRLAVPATVVAVLAAGSVGYAVLPGHGRPTVDAGAGLPDSRSLGTVDLSQRGTDSDSEQTVSRSATRPEPQPGRSGVETADVPEPSDHLWATAELNLWSGPGEDTDLVGVVPDGTRVAVTGAEENGFAEIVRDGYARWVNAMYLSEDNPTTSTSTGPGAVSYAPCRLGSSVESGSPVISAPVTFISATNMPGTGRRLSGRIAYSAALAPAAPLIVGAVCNSHRPLSSFQSAPW